MTPLPEEEWQRLLKRQEELEEAAYTAGVKKFNKRLDSATEKGTAYTAGAAVTLLGKGVEKLAPALKEFCKPSQSSARTMSVRWIERVGAETAALITLQAVLGGLGTEQRRTDVALDIADRIQDELRYRKFKEKAPFLFAYKQAHLAGSKSYDHKKRSMDASIRISDIDVSGETMDDNMRYHVGSNLIDLCELATAFVSKETQLSGTRRNPRKTNTLRPTQETMDLLSEANARREGLRPALQPMVVPPLRWEKGELDVATGTVSGTARGGYRFQQRAGWPLVIQRNRLKLPEERQQQGVSLAVHQAVNQLQEVPFRVNKRVLAVVEEIWRNNLGRAGIPLSEKIPQPAKPADISTNEAAKKAWKKKSHAAHEAEKTRWCDATRFLTTRNAAKEFSEYERIYYPFHIDFTGRAYPLPTCLSPQGDDLDRGLLLFAQGKPIDAAGARWLAIYGASCLKDMTTTPGGKMAPAAKASLLTLDEREKWVHDNTQHIIRTADDPFADMWWAEADKPLRFLAFCFEWTNVIRANDRGEEHVCALPIALDGSANALQLWASLLRDAKLGADSNVTPADVSQDPYAMMAAAVVRRLEVLASQGNTMATRWLGLNVNAGVIDRDMLKNPAMTYTYSATLEGLKERMRVYPKERKDYRAYSQHFGADLRRACTALAQIIWDTLEAELPAAARGMNWIREATAGITAAGRHPHWTVPLTDFLVDQHYEVSRKRRIRTVIGGGTAITKTTYMERFEPTGRVDSVDHQRGIAANYIHSLDAAIMFETTHLALGNGYGVESVSMVHDSFATVPADCERLSRACRQAFAGLFISGDVLDGIYRELASQWPTPDDCPTPPVAGELDVSAIFASPYAYSC